MPFKSKAQQRYFYANRKKLEAQGVDVAEWSKDTDFKHLPEKAAGSLPLPPVHSLDLVRANAAAENRIQGQLERARQAGIDQSQISTEKLIKPKRVPAAVLQAPSEGMVRTACVKIDWEAHKSWGGRSNTPYGVRLLKMWERKDPDGFYAAIRQGMKVETEHDKHDVNKQIFTTLDHLVEGKNYYPLLDEMEKKLVKAAEIHVAARVLGSDGFDYTMQAGEFWRPLIKAAMEKANIHFDLENDDEASKDSRRTFKVGDYDAKVVLYFAGGDWETPVAYFRCQGPLGKTSVHIPGLEDGNVNLEKSEKGWHPSQDQSTPYKKFNQSQLWRWVEKEVQKMGTESTKSADAKNIVPGVLLGAGLGAGVGGIGSLLLKKPKEEAIRNALIGAGVGGLAGGGLGYAIGKPNGGTVPAATLQAPTSPGPAPGNPDLIAAMQKQNLNSNQISRLLSQAARDPGVMANLKTIYLSTTPTSTPASPPAPTSTPVPEKVPATTINTTLQQIADAQPPQDLGDRSAAAERAADAAGRKQPKAEVYPTSQVTVQDAPGRGDEVHVPLIANPFNTPDQGPNDAADYENGYQYAQEAGHMVLGGVMPEQMAQWAGRSVAWRKGFAEGLRKMGRGDLADQLEATISEGHPMKAAVKAASFTVKLSGIGGALLGAALPVAAGAGLGYGIGEGAEHLIGLPEATSSVTTGLGAAGGAAAAPLGASLMAPVGLGFHKKKQATVERAGAAGLAAGALPIVLGGGLGFLGGELAAMPFTDSEAAQLGTGVASGAAGAIGSHLAFSPAARLMGSGLGLISGLKLPKADYGVDAQGNPIPFHATMPEQMPEPVIPGFTPKTSGVIRISPDGTSVMEKGRMASGDAAKAVAAATADPSKKPVKAHVLQVPTNQPINTSTTTFVKKPVAA